MPMWMSTRGMLCRLDHRMAQILAPGFSNTPGLNRRAAQVNACAKTSIADQLPRLREMREVPDGAQHGHGRDQPDARLLNQQWHPLILGCQFGQARFEALDLLVRTEERLEV